MKSVQALLIDCSQEWEAMFRQLKIEFVSSSSLDVMDQIQNESINPAIIFVHFSYKKMDASHEEHPFVRELFKNIPEHTRRILFCNGMDRPASAKNAAICYGGDLLVDGMKLYDDSDRAYHLNNTVPLKGIVDRGFASETDINERGRTIELENGQREGIGVPPERKADKRYHPYNDEDYIQIVKSRGHEK